MPFVRLRKGHAKPLWNRHPWVYRGAVQAESPGLLPGDVVDVQDPSGGFMGRGFWNGLSSIAVRIMAWDRDEEIGPDLFRRRIRAAAGLRKRLGVCDAATGYRLVHSEGDGLPGLVVDRYADFLCVQAGTAGMHRRLDEILDALEAEVAPAGIVSRPDPHFAGLEGFAPREGVLRGRGPGAPVEIMENGVRFEVDLEGGQKTGFYYDQRENRLRVAGLSAGLRILDVCSYTGAFALCSVLRGGASAAVCIETSQAAAAAAERNASLNSAGMVEVRRADASIELKAIASSGEAFDVAVTDPPKFVHSQDGLEDGLRAYKALNRLAMQALARPGLLAACSCSGLVGDQDFERMLMKAAIEAGRDIRVIERRGQAPDHPVSPACPESRYLKCFLCAID